MWTICIFFTIQASIVLLAIGLFTYATVPVVEASEQNIIQTVIPPDRGSIRFCPKHRAAASPLTAFMIGPIAQFIFIPL